GGYQADGGRGGLKLADRRVADGRLARREQLPDRLAGLALAALLHPDKQDAEPGRLQLLDGLRRLDHDERLALGHLGSVVDQPLHQLVARVIVVELGYLDVDHREASTRACRMVLSCTTTRRSRC